MWELTRIRQWSRRSLFFAALTCTIRPTAAVTWVFLYGVLLWRLRHDLRAVGQVLFQVAYIGFVMGSRVGDNARTNSLITASV